MLRSRSMFLLRAISIPLVITDGRNDKGPRKKTIDRCDHRSKKKHVRRRFSGNREASRTGPDGKSLPTDRDNTENRKTLLSESKHAWESWWWETRRCGFKYKRYIAASASSAALLSLFRLPKQLSNANKLLSGK